MPRRDKASKSEEPGRATVELKLWLNEIINAVFAPEWGAEADRIAYAYLDIPENKEPPTPP